MQHLPPARFRFFGAIGISLLILSSSLTPALDQVPADQAAETSLESANRAYGEKNFTTAITRFREHLSKFGTHTSSSAARHGLALSLLHFPGEKNDTEARDLLQSLAADKNTPDYPNVLYHLGLAQRGLGLQELALASARPSEATQRHTKAKQLFEDAAKRFADSEAAFRQTAPPVTPETKSLPVAWEWIARARCDQAEVLLRLQKTADAHGLTTVFVHDPVLTRSRHRDQGRYLHGFASFLRKDYATAERVLSMVAPFSDPGFGPHARYLLARTHHLADERAEAAHHYEGVVADYARHKKAALEALKRPDLLSKDPMEKARLEVLVRNAAPDHVARAAFYWGILSYEGGRFADARQRFAEFPKLYPQSPLLIEAQMRLGICQVQLKEFAEAQKTLVPLAVQEHPLGDQILFWLAKARVGALPDPKHPSYLKAVSVALANFQQAAERAAQTAGNEPDAKVRRAEILLELADTKQLVQQHKEAGILYAQLLAEKNLAHREEEIHQRLATALHLAGAYDESDAACTRFLETFPRSTLLPAVLFRHAENGYFRLLAAENDPALPDRAKALVGLADETAKRYQHVIDKYPEFTQVGMARNGLAMTHYRKGELDKARQTLEAIASSDRHGELVNVPYFMADCILRQTPTTIPEDALAAGKLEEQLKSAVQLLDGFAGSQPQSPHTPYALLQLGQCHERLSTLHADKVAKLQALRSAQVSFEKLLAPQYAKDPLQPQALFERAKLFGQMGGKMPVALAELRRFTAAPLKSTPIAPMALLHLATLLRSENKAAEAAETLLKARQWYELDLDQDPRRSNLVPLLQYHHGVAQRESGRLAEARVIFEVIVKQRHGSIASQAALRFGQSLKDDGRLQLDHAKKALSATKSPEAIADAEKLRQEGRQTTRAAVTFLEDHATKLKEKEADAETRARMLYEIAWAYRQLAEVEIDGARDSWQAVLITKLGPNARKFLPEIPLAKISPPQSETKARATYLALIREYQDMPLATDARFELAELYAQRDDHDGAIKLLNEALDREPPDAMTERIRLRLGASHAAKGNPKAALAQFNIVAQNSKSPLLGQAHYRIGEVYLASQQWAEAVKRMSMFRDVPQFQNQASLSDRALLRLGYAYAQLNQWDQSRQAYEVMTARFGTSLWVHEGRFGMGWALQQAKQYDQAVNVFSRVTTDTVTETAAKAQLQIGLCQLEQKRYQEAANAFLAVVSTYEFAELSAAALVNAASALVELKLNDEAIKLLQRVVRDYAQTASAETARQRLEKLEKR